MVKIVVCLLSGAALAALSVLAAMPARADCTCRAHGRDFDLGRTICLSTPSGNRLAICDMVLNNTSWKISANPCTEASARPRPTPRQASVHRHSGPQH